MPRAASWLLKRAHLLIPLLILLPVLWALLPGGLPNSADGMVHFVRITEIVSSWRDGILLPRWSLNLGFGYGIPVFIYGPPLSYLLGAAYYTLGLDAEAAYKAMLVTILLIGTSGAYRLGKLLLGVYAGVVAAAAFAYAPTQLFTLFVQGNAPQLLAWSFLPWALWATIQIFRTPHPRQRVEFAALLALAVAGTLISHNVVSLILVPTVAALGVLLWITTRRHGALLLTAGSGLLGLLLSAWFAVPALLETTYASTDAIAASDYRTRFVPLTELLAWPMRLDAGAINPYIPRTLGLPQVVIALVGLLFLVGWLFFRRPPTPEQSSGHPVEPRVFWATAIFMTLYAGFCALMATDASAPIWEKLPLLDFFQFPARWNGFAGVGVAWLAAAAVGLVARRLQPILAGVICLFLIGAALVYLYPDKTPPGTRVVSTYEVVRYEEQSGAIGTTSYGEFNPRWAQRPLPPSPMLDDYMAHQPVDRLKGMLPEGASHRILKVTAHRQLYQITLPAPATISVNLLYFPGWAAQVNQKPVELWPQEGTGLITVDLPAGESTLDLTFGPTPLRRAVGIVSSVAWLTFILGFVLLKVRTPSPHPTQPLATPVTGRTLATVGGVVGVLLLLQVVGADYFQLHSPPDQALAAPVVRHDDIGGKFRLLGQNALPTTVRAGATLPVIAYWRSLADMDENYSVVLRLEDVGSNQTLVEMVQAHPSDIPTTGWATGLYVRNEWQVEIPADALPLQYALRTGFSDPATEEMLPSETGTMVELGRLWVLPQDEPKPANGPSARFGPTIELLGAGTDGEVLTLYWRADAPVSGEYSIFVHLLDAEGQILGQMDGLPFANRYPLWAWRPGQFIEDRREVAATEVDLAQLQRIAVGVYDSVTGDRLAATDGDGNPLANNAVMISWEGK